MATTPQISVVIPVFNCRNYLVQTLRSVLAQDPGPDVMHIEVIDDASTDNPGEAVAEVGGGRVEYFRKPANEGLTKNFNTCVARARAPLIHLLHGDDLVRPGFYQHVFAAFAKHADLAMFTCPAKVIDQDNKPMRLDPIPPLTRSGRYEGFHHLLVPANPLRTPSVVLPRRTYDQVGAFDLRVTHCTDWNMWLKASSAGPVWFEAAPLVEYRVHRTAGSRGQLGSGNYLVEYWKAVTLWIEDLRPARGAEYRERMAVDLVRRALDDWRAYKFSAERLTLLGGVFRERIPELAPRFQRELRRLQWSRRRADFDARWRLLWGQPTPATAAVKATAKP